MVVSKIRKDNRGFVRDRYVAILRRKIADLGIDVAAVVNWDDASSGKDSSLLTGGLSLLFRCFLLRCGRTSAESVVEVGWSGTESSFFKSAFGGLYIRAAVALLSNKIVSKSPCALSRTPRLVPR